jgi:hypothetical protein
MNKENLNFKITFTCATLKSFIKQNVKALKFNGNVFFVLSYNEQQQQHIWRVVEEAGVSWRWCCGGRAVVVAEKGRS